MDPQEQAIESQVINEKEGEALIQVLEEETTEILSKMDNRLLRDRERWDHSKNNWASEIHHPCLKHLVHCRLDWKKRQLIDINGLYRVTAGSEQERRIKVVFSDIGHEINQSQRYFRMESHQISGKIDGMLPLTRELPGELGNIKELPGEVKTVNPHFWESVKSVLDLKRHPKFWINKIPSQLNLYLLMMELPAGFIILDTFGKRPRILPMLFDPELAKEDLEKAEKVNYFVERGEYPEPIPYDSSICGLCGFDHICSPLKTTDCIEINSESKWELEDYLLLKKQDDDFKKLHAELIGNGKKPGKYYGKNGIIEDIEVKSRTQIRKQYDIPKEVKDKFYTGDNEINITSIERIGKEW